VLSSIEPRNGDLGLAVATVQFNRYTTKDAYYRRHLARTPPTIGDALCRSHVVVEDNKIDIYIFPVMVRGQRCIKQILRFKLTDIQFSHRFWELDNYTDTPFHEWDLNGDLSCLNVVDHPNLMSSYRDEDLVLEWLQKFSGLSPAFANLLHCIRRTE